MSPRLPNPFSESRVRDTTLPGQLNILDAQPEPEPVAHARRTDPDTSHEAAAAVSPTLRPRQAAVLALFRALGPMADVEMLRQYRMEFEAQARGLGVFDLRLPAQSDSGLRTRRSELVAAGELTDLGKKKIGRRYHHIWGRA